MRQKLRLDSVQMKVLTYIWLNNCITDRYQDLAEKLGLPTYLTRKTVGELCRRNWIIKQRLGNKIAIQMCKRSLTNYVLQEAEKHLTDF